jgi:putative transposase
MRARFEWQLRGKSGRLTAGQTTVTRECSAQFVTPTDIYFGHAPTILDERERIKRQTIADRHLKHQLQA